MSLFSRRQTVAAATAIASAFVKRAIDRYIVDVRSAIPAMTQDGRGGHIVRVAYCAITYDVLVIDRKIERVDYYGLGDDAPDLPKLGIEAKGTP